ncbi:MAG: T9SS type A sorting domain-containing protein [Bacteroidetes bacterium]|nr:T9SS type A sorting domain-containing protein [Bacteroidota bacterium]
MNKLFTIYTLLLLSLSAIAQIPQNGLVAFYPLDNNALDDGPNKYHGDTNSTITTGDHLNRPGRAIEFSAANGGNAIMNFSKADKMKFKNKFTISFWMYIPTAQINQYPTMLILTSQGVNKYGMTFNLVGVNPYAGAVLSTIGGGDNKYVNVAPLAPLANRWIHTVLVYDSINFSLYGDTVLLNSRSMTGDVKLGPSDSLLTLGGGINGRIDDLAFYNRALSKSEIKALFLDTTSKMCTLHSATISGTSSLLTASAGAKYQWLRNDTIIPGANAQSYAPTSSASYSCIVYNLAGCDAVSNSVMTVGKITTSINQIENALRIYPNPVVDVLNIASDLAVKSITIFDLNGMLITSNTNQATINFNSLHTGIYIAEIKTENGIIRKMITKE